MLAWAADLHESGLSLSHSQYQKHSAYLVQESDMAGFSQQEQLFLSILVGHHRRDIPEGYAVALPSRFHEPSRMLLFSLRFTCILCRTRDDLAIQEFTILRDDQQLYIRLGGDWAAAHPLTMANLEQERVKLKLIGLFPDISLDLD